jgi:hypothetical protein
MSPNVTNTIMQWAPNPREGLSGGVKLIQNFRHFDNRQIGFRPCYVAPVFALCRNTDDDSTPFLAF